MKAMRLVEQRQQCGGGAMPQDLRELNGSNGARIATDAAAAADADDY